MDVLDIFTLIKLLSILSLLIILPSRIRKLFQNEVLVGLAPVVISISLVIGCNFATKNISNKRRDLGIKNGQELVEIIADYKHENGVFPKQLSDLKKQHKNLPKPNVYKNDSFDYKRKKGDQFVLEFRQNALLGWNYEILQYSSDGEHTTTASKLYPTKFNKWKYFIYD